MKPEDFTELFPQYRRAESIRPITAGWSHDIKFCITQQGESSVIKISPAGEWERKNTIAHILRKFGALPYPMARFHGLTLSADGAWLCLDVSWVVGEPLEEVLPNLPQEEQYRLGGEAGQFLHGLHQIPLEPQDIPTPESMEKRIQMKQQRLLAYESSPRRIPGDQTALAFFAEHVGILSSRKQVYSHGDYHAGNLIYTPDKGIGIIDFDRCRVAPFVREFVKIQSFDREISIPYSVGMIHGYWGGNPHQDFWKSLAVYQAYVSLFSIEWAVPFGIAEINDMQRRLRTMLEDYDYFNRLIPQWYLEYS